MRRNDYLLQPEQRMVRGWWLALEDVQRSAGDLTGVDGVEQSGFIDQTTPRTIDDPDAVLHLSKGIRADQPSGFSSQRGMYRKEVGPCEKFIQRRRLDVQVPSLVGSDERIMRDDLHTVSPGARGHRTPDPPETDNAQGLALQFGANEP